MFRKVLIANRGEIAVRICRTLDEMGVASAAVYAHADRGALHVEAAGEAYPLGDGGVAKTYLDKSRLLEAVDRSGADAVHPGYGFLSENADFARALEERGVTFVGPRPEHLECFGLKHKARRLASAAGVELLPGSGVLGDVEDALREAAAIGYPVMLKSTGGGGGIGMRRCENADELAASFAAVQRLAGRAFGDTRLFLERCVANPRHVEVQALGDGAGGVLILGDRDCSLQRRHQKVIEECPAPNLPEPVRGRMHEDARALLSSVQYQSAGTVEFVYDPEREAAAFLEVNTRLQVEHGITELVFGVDLVRWMLELAAGELRPLDALESELLADGWAMEARLCAEDPKYDFRPTPGWLSVCEFPQAPWLRTDTWLRSGTEIPAHYDSLLAKVMACGSTREEARRQLRTALEESVLHGVETNREFLHQILECDAFAKGEHDTGTIDGFTYRPYTVEVLVPGVQTTVQAWPGRLGYWHVGVPPSGPMDDLSFRLGNRLLGNHEGAPGLEITVAGPTLAFQAPATVVVAGAVEIELEKAGSTVSAAPWQSLAVGAGDVLSVGRVTAGMRAYVLVAGGLEVPEVMGSAATFTLGGIGGMNGRMLAAGDVLRLSSASGHRGRQDGQGVPAPRLDARHVLRVTMGPHCTDDFLMPEYIDALLSAEWLVHYHSDRTGVRLIGPHPRWARPDGGDAGLHPSNVHDNPYAFGAIDFTGDMPVVLGPDGPSLGGFVCPAAVIEADRWKLGQLGSGDHVRLVAVTEAEAGRIARERDDAIAACSPQAFAVPQVARGRVQDPIVCEVGDIRVRRAAQDSILVEFGPNVLDIGLRMRVHGLEAGIAEHRVSGVLETTAGIRSLLIRFDPGRRTAPELARELEPLFERARNVEQRVVSRTVHLPLSWDDPACRAAIEKYVQSVRPDAPWCPDNIEFIRRINGLRDRQAVKDIVFSADYLVMGLGDVYLGAPVATPVDPRHRLVTTKYNPARTWTAENSVGIGGAYLCIYGMEGPGGYQFVGRTLQVWNHYRRGRAFDEHWLLRPFDRIRFYEVDPTELLEMREAFSRGALDLDIGHGNFDYESHRAFLAKYAEEIASFEACRRTAFSAELEDWKARGVLTFETAETDGGTQPAENANGAAFATSPMAGSVWSVHVQPGQRVQTGDLLFIVESMKTEFRVVAPTSGVVADVLISRGQAVQAGQALALAA